MSQHTGTNYKFDVHGVSIGEHKIAGSESWSVGFVDSGTTFTYLPNKMFDQIMLHFDNFCSYTKDLKDESGNNLYCPAPRFMTMVDGSLAGCFSYEKWNGSLKEFFMSYPII
mmetsp:Transcript_41864/g.64063  ORF Transcript_41864/g.64063 Transcript_41864/m.64063 type:complete len:112 (-) Transcript_41864:958-1293(-)